MHPVLATALAKICQERDEKSYSASLDAVSAIVRHFGEVNLAEVLFSEIPRTVPFELVAELFDLLAWQTNDNGASMPEQLKHGYAGIRQSKTPDRLAS